MYKDLTPENWLNEDDIFESLRAIGGDFDTQRWAQSVLTLQMGQVVPEPVRDLYGVARGALLYGSFFYPMFTLGLEQLYRVTEAAVGAKCKAMQAPSSKRSYAQRVAWLKQQGIIPQRDTRRWVFYRQMRNSRSHPDMQMLLTPGQVLEQFNWVLESVNRLFPLR